MNKFQLKEDIYYVGVNDAERRIFDALIPLPDGTTYNSYIIKGSEKVAMIDTADPAKKNILLSNLDNLKLGKIDYIISHHGEQDHSGAIPDVLEKFPMAKVLTNSKCKAELMDLLHIEEDKFIVVGDGQEVSLGNKTLKFIFTPWVHWPETFVTYLVQDKIIFTCDFLGSHYGFEPSEGLFVSDNEKIINPAKRYFAEIMSPFRTNIRKNLEKIKDLDIDIVAPSHGPLYRGAGFITDCYFQWSCEDVKNEVLIAYVSMHGSTDKIVDYFTVSLKNRGINVKSFDLAEADIGEIAMALMDCATAVIGSPTVLAGPHPSAVFAAYLVKALRPKLKYLSVIGLYGWGGKMVEQLAGLLGSLNAEIIEPVLVKGYPREADFKSLDILAENIMKKHKESGLF